VEGAWIRAALIAAASCVNVLSVFLLFLLLQRNVGAIFLGASLMQCLITGGVGSLAFAAYDGYSGARFRKAG